MVLRYKTSIYENIVNLKYRISFLSDGRIFESNLIFFCQETEFFIVPGNNTTTIAAGSVTKTLMLGKRLVK